MKRLFYITSIKLYTIVGFSGFGSAKPFGSAAPTTFGSAWGGSSNLGGNTLGQGKT